MSFAKWLAAAAVCLFLVSMLPGCAQATPTSEPATVTFALPEVDVEYYETLVAKFNESYPYITVELLDYESGEQDVALVSPYQIAEMRAQGDILSLDPFIEQESFDQADFYPGAIEMFAGEGKTWGIPAGVDPMVMYYNRDVFDLYGVPYPHHAEWTWDDFLLAGLGISDPEAEIFGYVSTPQASDPLTFIYQHGGRILDDLQDPTRVTFDDPLTVEAVEWYVDLINVHNVAPTPEQARRAFGIGNRALYQAILRGKVGMWVGMFSERGGLTWPLEWDMNWGILPLPSDAQSVTGGQVEGYVISSWAEYPDACWLWVDFLSRQIPYRLAPARRSLAESDEYELQVGKDIAAPVRASLESAVLISPDLSGFDDALELFFTAVEEAVAGNLEPEEAMRWAQDEAER